MMLSKIFLFISRVLISCAIIAAGIFVARFLYNQSMLTKIIARLRADSRAAEVLVTAVHYNQEQRKNFTTIKFLEYDTKGQPLAPKYFTFPGNIIQFQALVVRFDDKFVMAGDRLRGQSVYLFWKAFMLDGANTKEYPINDAYEIPGGYRVKLGYDWAQESFWRNFWNYALDKQASARLGIKNAQIEAPGAIFIPGYLYTIKIEHNGGLRIDTKELPAVMRGEKIL